MPAHQDGFHLAIGPVVLLLEVLVPPCEHVHSWLVVVRPGLSQLRQGHLDKVASCRVLIGSRANRWVDAYSTGSRLDPDEMLVKCRMMVSTESEAVPDRVRRAR